MNFDLLKLIVVPHVLKVAVFVALSAGLTFLLNNVAQLNLDADKQMVVLLVINVLLAGLKKYQEEK